MRYIDVSCLLLREQCAKKLVPLKKIPGKTNSADLITKYLTGLVIKRRVEELNLEFGVGRSEKSAKLHSIFKKQRQATAALHSEPRFVMRNTAVARNRRHGTCVPPPRSRRRRQQPR